MKFITYLFLGLAFSGATSAGDQWDNCSNADGSVRLTDGVLTIVDTGEVIKYSGEPKVLTTVKEEQTTCVLKDSGELATVYKNTITVEEIMYSSREQGPSYSEIMLCSRGVGNLVPQEFCKE